MATWDRARLPLLDDVDGTCSADGDTTLFAFYPKVVSLPNGGTSTCRQPVRMRRLRFKKSQWGEFAQDSEGAADAPLMVAKKVGGTTDDPCLELTTTDFTLADLVELSTGGMRFHPVTVLPSTVLIPDVTYTSSTVVPIVLTEYPVGPSIVWPRFKIQMSQVTNSGDTLHGESSTYANGIPISTIGGIGGSNFCYPLMPVATSALTCQILLSPSVANVTVRLELLGYDY